MSDSFSSTSIGWITLGCFCICLLWIGLIAAVRWYLNKDKPASGTDPSKGDGADKAEGAEGAHSSGTGLGDSEAPADERFEAMAQQDPASREALALRSSRSPREGILPYDDAAAASLIGRSAGAARSSKRSRGRGPLQQDLEQQQQQHQQHQHQQQQQQQQQRQQQQTLDSARGLDPFGVPITSFEDLSASEQALYPPSLRARARERRLDSSSIQQPQQLQLMH